MRCSCCRQRPGLQSYQPKREHDLEEFATLADKLRKARSKQPKVTLREARAQAKKTQRRKL
jgi:hypothetical protein